MKPLDRESLLRKRQQLLRELDSIHAVLSTTAGPGSGGRKKKSPRFANLSPGKAVRKLLVEEARPSSRERIIQELVEGGAAVGSKHAEQNIRRAIEVNVELGLLVETSGMIGLPEWHAAPRLQSPNVKDGRVRLVLQKMHLDIDSPLSIGALAESVRLSPSRLSHLFRSELEMSPAQYLKRIRIFVAGNMLRKTRLSQKEILAATGITDRSHFTRHFKRIYGESPSQFRVSPKKRKNRHQIAETATRFFGK